MIAVLLLHVVASAAGGDAAPIRARICLNGTWQFGPLFDRDWHQPSNLDDTKTLKWETARVPGTWRGGDWMHEAEFLPSTVRLARVDEAWYRRSIEVPADWRGSSVRIEFGAVGYFAEVYVNGRLAGRHVGGFTPFAVEVGRHVRYGAAADLLVFVKGFRRGWDKPHEGCLIASGNRFAGIWQDVFLTRRPQRHVEDAHVRTSVRDKRIEVDVEIGCLDGAARANLVLKCHVAHKGKRVLEFAPREIEVAPGAPTRTSVFQAWPNPLLWSPQKPHLYEFVCELHEQSVVIDRFSTRFGFREIWIDGRDFRLNGRVTRLRAFLYDHGVPLSMYRRDFLTGYFRALKEQVNYNAVRFFNIVPKTCLEVADEVGLLVAEGSAITSMELRSRFDAQQSNEVMKREFSEWIRDHRNHPSIVIWETDNENWTVGFSLVKAGREVSPEHFEWLPNFGFSMEELRRDVDRYYAWLTSLDGWIREHDDTRIITHSGAMLELGFDTAAHDEPDLHECRYLAGDLHGFMDHYDFHYPYEKHARREMVRFMRHWAETKRKPMIVGEFLAEETYPQEGWGIRILGEQALTGYTLENAAAGEDVSRLLKGWRSAGVSAMFLFYPNYYVFKNVVPEDFRFEWDDLATPGAKPVRPANRYFNPGWAPGAPECVPNRNSGLYDQLKQSLSPLLVTFGEQWRRHGLSGETLARKVYVVNDTEAAERVRWTAGLSSGGEAAGELTLRAGEIHVEDIVLDLPRVDATRRLELSLRLSRRGEIVSHERQQVTVFAREFQRPPDLPPARIAVLGRVHPLAWQTFEAAFLDDLSALSQEVDLLVIPENAAGALADADERARVVRYLAAGGRLLVLEQDAAALERVEELQRLQGGQFAEYTHVQMASPGHPVLDGIEADDLHDWNGRNGILASRPYSRLLRNGRALLFAGWRHAPLVEGRFGPGRYVLSQLHLGGRYGRDPVATHLLHNLVRYLLTVPDAPECAAGYMGDDSRIARRYKLQRPLGDDMGRYDVLVVGRGGWSRDSPIAARFQQIMQFVAQGGTLLLLPQDPQYFATNVLPGDIALRRFDGRFICKERSTAPILWGVSGFDLTISRPQRGLTAGEWDGPKLSAEIVGIGPPWASLLLVSTRFGNRDIYAMEDVGGVFPSGGSALARARFGKGEIILCQLDIDRESRDREGSAPPHDVLNDQALNVADALFYNLGIDRVDGP
ncbi:MAG: hypothetical protein CMJ18_18540 [Phycisphaeraceae bacterium]|nr:hypothetical protein [Phycisphaeraceae bacterium]